MKIFLSTLCLLGFYCSFMCSMDKDSSKKNNEIIKGATHYAIIRGGVTSISDSKGTREVYNKPRAFFFIRSDSDDNENMKKVTFEKWDEQTEKLLNARLDPAVAHLRPQPTKATIFFDIKLGRAIKCDGGYGYHAYRDGPADIKGAQQYIGLRKPHSMFDNLKKVTERECILFFTYDKKKIIYEEDGKKTETISWKHRLVQCIYTSLAVGVVYATYILIKKAFVR